MHEHDLITRYFACLNEERWGELEQLWTEEARYVAVGTRPRQGPREIVDFCRGLFEPWQTHQDEPSRVLLCGSTATVEVTFTGTTPEGRTITFDAVDVIDFRDGRIQRLSNWYDLVYVRKQLVERG